MNRDWKELKTERNKPGQVAMFKDEEREKAFFRRYGKKVNVFPTFTMNPDKTFNEVTLRFESLKGNHYVIQEIFKNNDTEKILLCFTKNNRKYEHVYKRFIDAEITLVDFLADELEEK